MFKVFQTTNIKDRIYEALETRLNALQKEYNDECVRIDDEALKAKINLADTMVNGVLDKII